MKLKQRKSKTKSRRHRGSVIVLVVAVLALLAVIGTVYIVSAHSERSGATSTSTAINLDNAQKAVNESALRVIGASIYDGQGFLGAYNAPGAFGVQVARRYDIHEMNFINPGASGFNPNARDQAWLCDNLYRYPNDLGDMTLLTPRAFDPSTGQYDAPYYAALAAPTPVFPFINNGTFRVVSDPLPTGLPAPDGTTFNPGDDALVQLLPFSEANGVRYRFGVRIIDSSRMANLNVGSIFDVTNPTPAQLYGTFMTEYSLASPAIFNPPPGFYPLDNPGSLAGTPGTANPGRLGSWNPLLSAPATPIDFSWLQAALRFENPATVAIYPFDLSDETELRSYGPKGTLTVPRVASVWPNTLANHASNSGVVAGNLNRQFYTANSWSRELRPFADPIVGGVSTAYLLHPEGQPWVFPPPAGNASALIWPMFPARVGANPDISTYNTNVSNAEQAADALVIAATNIATAMSQSKNVIPVGYSDDEAKAYVANYLTCRWSSWAPASSAATQTLNGNTYYVYQLVGGPSFIDQSGPCLRSGLPMPNNGNYLSDLNTGTSTKVVIGYAAQPFINEAVTLYTFVPDAVNPPGKWVESDGAVELYNPYDVALSLDDFKLNINGTDIDFTGKGQWIPPRGYFVLTEVPGQLDTLPTPIPNTAVKIDAQSKGLTLQFKGGAQAYLMRKYYDRAGNPQWAAVDQYDFTALNGASLSPLGGAPVTTFVARPNLDDGTTATNEKRWVATMHDKTVAEVGQSSGLTLGSANAAPVTVPNYFIPLYDRTLELYPALAGGPAPVPDYMRLIPVNIADFARIMRITHQIDPTAAPGGTPTDNGVISFQLNAAAAAAPTDPNVMNCLNPPEAMVRFDFLAAPALFSNPLGAAPNPAIYKSGDPRAVNLLECLSFTDRVSDFTINLGDNDSANRGISKIRIPGQINVNTASPQVLATIPILVKYPQLIGYILAYRWRTTTADQRIPPVFQATGAAGFDFTDAVNFPGYGVRALSELEVPLFIARTHGIAPPMTTTTLFDRDQFWGDIYNTLTVRSDTFVVYAYLEAVKQNPRYSGLFNNSDIWYNTSGAVTDDPTDSTHALLRVARKRWVSLVDRSQSNFNRFDPYSGGLDPRFTQPRIVATKDLPQ